MEIVLLVLLIVSVVLYRPFYLNGRDTGKKIRATELFEVKAQVKQELTASPVHVDCGGGAWSNWTRGEGKSDRDYQFRSCGGCGRIERTYLDKGTTSW
jgi:membrane protein implicated in regulation of membrane protease activity